VLNLECGRGGGRQKESLALKFITRYKKEEVSMSRKEEKGEEDEANMLGGIVGVSIFITVIILVFISMR
jgi:hypothetical protein